MIPFSFQDDDGMELQLNSFSDGSLIVLASIGRDRIAVSLDHDAQRALLRAMCGHISRTAATSFVGSSNPEGVRGNSGRGVAHVLPRTLRSLRTVLADIRGVR